MRTATAAAVILLGLVSLGTTHASAQSARDRAKVQVDSGNYAAAATLYEDAVRQAPKDKGVLAEAGDVNMELDRFTIARDYYARAYDIDDDDLAVMRKYASALLSTGDAPKAISLLNAAVKKDGSLENYLALGRGFIKAGKDSLNRAELTFQTAGQKYPKSADVQVALGDLYFAREIYELAVSKYEQALEINKDLIEPRIHLGRAYREMGRHEEADDTARLEWYNKALLEFNRVTALAARQPRPWIEQGEIFMLAHQYENAGRSFEEYVGLRPDDPRGDVLLARAAFAGNYYKQALVPLERILTKTDPTSKAFADSARSMLGKSYYALKDYGKARDFYAAASDSLLDPEAKKLFASSILLSGGDTSRAVTLYRSLVDANPSDCDLSNSLGGLMYNLKRYDDVIDVYMRRMTACPAASKATPMLYIGLSHFARARYDQAIDALNSSIAADSSSVQAYYWLMNVYAKKEQYAKASDVARTMVAHGLDKTNPKEVAMGFFFGGVERFKAKDYRGALAAFDKVIRLNPENPQAYLYTAFCYQLQNDKESACKNYHLALKYDPKNPDALKNMKALSCQ